LLRAKTLYSDGSIWYYLLVAKFLKRVKVMKKAVIATGGKQYIVTEGETLEVELLHAEGKTVSFEALLVSDGDNVVVGTPIVPKVTIKADIIDDEVKGDKVTAIRYKAKKRVHKVHGHRQQHTVLKITKIA
jgi:large subunit ribosomal protein L21